MPAKGGTEQKYLEVPSGSLCMTCLWPLQRQQLSGWVIALITDHQAQWTINLNEGHHYQMLHYVFGTSCAEILIDVFHEQACTKNRVERFHSPLFVTSASGFRKEAGEKPTELVSTHRGKKNSKSCPSEKCGVKYDMLNSIFQSIMLNFWLRWAKGTYWRTTTPNPLCTLQEIVSLLPDRPPR